MNTMNRDWLPQEFHRTRLPKADLARYLVTDPAIVSRAISDPGSFSDFQHVQARAFFSVVPDDASAELTDAVRRLRSPAMRTRVVTALGQFLKAHGVQAAGDHPIDRCLRGEPLRADQIGALCRVLGIALADLTRSTAVDIRPALSAPASRAELLDRLELEAKHWSRGLEPRYYIEQGRAAVSISPLARDGERDTNAGGPVELRQTRAPSFDDVTDGFLILNDLLKPRYECGEILCVAWNEDAVAKYAVA